MANHKLTSAIFCGILWPLYVALSRLQVKGRENLPERGGFLVAANHLSILEVPLVFWLLRHYNVTGLVAKKHQKNPVFRVLVNAIGGIWLNREEADSHALRTAINHLRNGGVLGISPEGTRSQTGALQPAKTGVAYLASMADVPIVPVGVSGTYKAMAKVFTLQRPRFIVNIGKPFRLPRFDRKDRDASLKNNTDEIMNQIAALLPFENRGVYAETPRVQELLKSQERL